MAEEEGKALPAQDKRRCRINQSDIDGVLDYVSALRCYVDKLPDSLKTFTLHLYGDAISRLEANAKAIEKLLKAEDQNEIATNLIERAFDYVLIHGVVDLRERLPLHDVRLDTFFNCDRLSMLIQKEKNPRAFSLSMLGIHPEEDNVQLRRRDTPELPSPKEKEDAEEPSQEEQEEDEWEVSEEFPE